MERALAHWHIDAERIRAIDVRWIDPGRDYTQECQKSSTSCGNARPELVADSSQTMSKRQTHHYLIIACSKGCHRPVALAEILGSFTRWLLLDCRVERLCQWDWQRLCSGWQCNSCGDGVEATYNRRQELDKASSAWPASGMTESNIQNCRIDCRT